MKAFCRRSRQTRETECENSKNEKPTVVSHNHGVLKRLTGLVVPMTVLQDGGDALP